MNWFQNTLKTINACRPAQVWAAGFLDFKSAWDACGRSDWMIWLLRELKFLDIIFYKKYACFCARQNWDKLKDERSKAAIVAAEQYIEGNISREELMIARSAAYAAYAADAAYAAYAADAADVACAYAAAAYAAADAAACAYAAAAAADAADAAYAADAYAAADARQSQANYIRLHVDFESTEAIFNRLHPVH